MLAVSIRQPYAELILSGVKTIEYRSRPTRLIGERFYIYASKGTKALRHAGTEGTEENIADMPRGVIVGTAVIARCTNGQMLNGKPLYEWHLSNVKRLPKPRKPKGRPQPVWFNPF